MDSSASVQVDPHRVQIVMPPDFALPPGGLNIRWPDPPLAQEQRLRELEAARGARLRARQPPRPRGDRRAQRRASASSPPASPISTCARRCDDLGIDEAEAAALGIALYKVGMTWPLEAEGAARLRRRAARRSSSSRRSAPLIEDQIKSDALQLPRRRRPRVDRQDSTSDGAPLLPSTGELDAARRWRAAIAGRIWRASTPSAADRRAPRRPRRQGARGIMRTCRAIERTPYFCSGCPHNTSTKVPEGSRALAGIGCHYMVGWMDRSTDTFTQMGGEGAPWIGQAPFTETPHVFANLGDGTYFHSGILAIRAAVAAGVNITYKILYNDAVAMTGGQPVDGPLDRAADRRASSPPRASTRIVVVTDEPEKYPATPDFAAGRHDRPSRRARRGPARAARDRRASRVLDLRPDLRRREAPPPQARPLSRSAEARLHQRGGLRGLRRLLASSRTASRSMPVETEFGRKRAIDQSTCNKDYSCVNGFCPSFVTVHGGSLKKRAPAGVRQRASAVLPDAGGAGARPSPMASSSPASAAPASSPSARCSAWPRISKARASSCST